MPDTLQLVRKQREGHPEQHYFEFLVNGQSLKGVLSFDSELIGALRWQGLVYDRQVLDELCLKQPSSLVSKRVGLYVCPECADISCGMLTVSIRMLSDSVIWEGFGYENGYDPIGFDEYKGFSFGFEKTDSIKLFESLEA